MKKLAGLLLVALLSSGAALADDARIEALSGQLAEQATAAIQAALAPEDSNASERPPTLRNWRLRGNIKDIRTVAEKLQKRASRGKGHSLVSKLKLKQIKANLRTCNFLVQNHAARGLEAFPPAWEAVRQTIKDLVGEMSCGHDPEVDQPEGDEPEGEKSVEEEIEE